MGGGGPNRHTQLQYEPRLARLKTKTVNAGWLAVITYGQIWIMVLCVFLIPFVKEKNKSCFQTIRSPVGKRPGGILHLQTGGIDSGQSLTNSLLQILDQQIWFSPKQTRTQDAVHSLRSTWHLFVAEKLKCIFQTSWSSKNKKRGVHSFSRVVKKH